MSFSFDLKSILQSYLWSYLFWSDLPLGALALALIYPLTGGHWGAVCRKILEAVSDTILCVAVFALPVLLGIQKIYPWMDPQTALEPKVFHKHLYLNPLSFILRTLFYFFCWITLNLFLQRWSADSLSSTPLVEREQLRRLGAGGIILLGFTVTFAAVDWQMSVEPTWYSTVYGMVYVIGQVLSTYAFVLIVFGLMASKFKLEFPKKTLWDLGNILLTLIMVWTYLSFMQYLIVWSGNLPDEVIWYLHRSQGGWQWVGLILVLFQFLFPFILLLFRRAKASPGRLALLGAMIFCVRILDHYWMLMPGLPNQRFEFSWASALIWIGMGLVWMSVFLRRLNSRPVFATSDPDWSLLAGAIHYMDPKYGE